MADLNPGRLRAAPVAQADMALDASLRRFMLGVYNKVALGLILSAAQPISPAWSRRCGI